LQQSKYIVEKCQNTIVHINQFWFKAKQALALVESFEFTEIYFDFVISIVCGRTQTYCYAPVLLATNSNDVKYNSVLQWAAKLQIVKI